MSSEALIIVYIVSVLAYVMWYNYIIVERAKNGEIPRAKEILLFYLEIPFAPIILFFSPILSFIGAKLTNDLLNDEHGHLYVDENGELQNRLWDSLKKRQQEKE